VLPERRLDRTLPKDDDRFDSFGDELFRDSYRIRRQDVFDLSFLFRNPRLIEYSALAQEAISGNFRLAEMEPFQSFAGGLIPGEEVLVTRMIYEVVKRLEVGKDIDFDRIIFVDGTQGGGGYTVRYLERVMRQLGEGTSHSAFFRRHEGKALAITFHHDERRGGYEPTASDAIPELRIVPCPADNAGWADLLWTMNQPEADGRHRSTILLRNDDDMIRLRRVIALKRIIDVNGGAELLRSQRFRVGSMLAIPEIKPEHAQIIDAQVADFFFQTEHYYAVALEIIERRISELDEALRRPEIRGLLKPEAELGMAELDAR
jgi:hypothetical protein